jgi:hypothetical protein
MGPGFPTGWSVNREYGPVWVEWVNSHCPADPVRAGHKTYDLNQGTTGTLFTGDNDV